MGHVIMLVALNPETYKAESLSHPFDNI